MSTEGTKVRLDEKNFFPIANLRRFLLSFSASAQRVFEWKNWKNFQMKIFSHQKWHLKKLGVAITAIGYTHNFIIVVIQLRLFHIG
jgi:hypothetical protein